jgi:putative transposase
VEETLNALLDAEADRLCNARRYQCTEARRDKLQTKTGEVKLRIPKLRTQIFETAIIGLDRVPGRRRRFGVHE